MNLNEIINELYMRVDAKQTKEEVHDWLTELGFGPTLTEGEPGYTEAAVGGIARSLGSFYMNLVLGGVPGDAARDMTIAYINITFGKR